MNSSQVERGITSLMSGVLLALKRYKLCPTWRLEVSCQRALKKMCPTVLCAMNFHCDSTHFMVTRLKYAGIGIMCLLSMLEKV